VYIGKRAMFGNRASHNCQKFSERFCCKQELLRVVGRCFDDFYISRKKF